VIQNFQKKTQSRKLYQNKPYKHKSSATSTLESRIPNLPQRCHSLGLIGEKASAQNANEASTTNTKAAPDCAILAKLPLLKCQRNAVYDSITTAKLYYRRHGSSFLVRRPSF